MQSRDEFQQTRFPASARSDHGDELALRDAERGFLERVNRALAALIDEANVIDLDERRIALHDRGFPRTEVKRHPVLLCYAYIQNTLGAV
jgi:hypothetical protein